MEVEWRTTVACGLSAQMSPLCIFRLYTYLWVAFISYANNIFINSINGMRNKGLDLRVCKLTNCKLWFNFVLISRPILSLFRVRNIYQRNNCDFYSKPFTLPFEVLTTNFVLHPLFSGASTHCPIFYFSFIRDSVTRNTVVFENKNGTKSST